MIIVWLVNVFSNSSSHSSLRAPLPAYGIITSKLIGGDEPCSSEQTTLVSSIMYRPSDGFEVIITLLYSSPSFL